ncbi:efflux RND transporter periplasmic adaptor subunit [Methylopila sp. Yamaguchi]|uniref:efflux RND transporter periplasmic adaptor subunit n=1 Tax=Methylopila sp. Yamaguchi TaxID=1437817 RepID=UPI000CBEA01C|nr:efflux RND transporter periplasmic adaptor subunit [Methylopila sp. Yamaguchi]GBD49142.1 efflux transporter, RND family, MFP subunit [Methylopila sp. Yamaguchi]
MNAPLRTRPDAATPVETTPPVRRRRRWPWVLGALAALGVGAFLFKDDLARYAAERQTPSQAADAAAPAAKPISVTVATATRREIAQVEQVTGTLVARDEVLVGAQIDGLRLDEYLVDVGDRVAQGQVLARLDRDMLETQALQNASSIAKAEAAIAQVEAAIAEAEASQVEALASLKRAEQLKGSGNVTGETLQARQTAAQVAAARVRAQGQNLKVAQADKALAEAQGREIALRLARTEVRAPSAGVVASRTARVGQIVGMAGEPLFRLVRDGEIELMAEATETRLHSIAAGQPARVTAAGVPEPFEGRVRLVEPTVDATTRLGVVRIALPTDRALRPGLFARGQIETARREGVTVPQSAILYGAEGVLVQVVKDGVVAERRVTLGLQDADGVEILEGIAAGEAVVARAGGFLRDGDRVAPVTTPAASASAADR